MPSTDIPTTSEASNGASGDGKVGEVQITPEMKKFAQEHLIRPLGQVVRIYDIDIAHRSFRVSTDIYVMMQVPMVEFIIDLGTDALLPSEDPTSTGSVTINGQPVTYYRNKDVVFDQNAAFTLPRYKNYAKVAYCRHDNSGLTISVPTGTITPDCNTLTLHVDVKVVNPRRGIFFVDLKPSGTNEDRSHMFTYASGSETSTHEWLPCFDRIEMQAVFDLSVVVDPSYTVYASGEFTECKLLDNGLSEMFYRHVIPTAANRVGFAIGSFGQYIHPEINDVFFAAPAVLLPSLKHTVAQSRRVMEFFEELLSTSFPFLSYKLVFVYNLPDKYVSYSGLTIMSAELLYHRKIIDTVLPTRMAFVNCIAEQYFGCFVQPASYKHLWLTKAIARFLTSLYIEHAFGHCEYVYDVYKAMAEVIEFEKRYGGIVLAPKTPNTTIISDCLDQECPLSASPRIFEAMVTKGFLVIRTLHNRLSKETFIKVLHRQIHLASQFGFNSMSLPSWYYLTLSMDIFYQTVINVTGREMPTSMEHWFHEGGHAHLEVSYLFNRKRNVIELEIKQEPGRGRLIYMGPLSIVVQEIDGSYSHIVQVDKPEFREEIQCHSKSRNKKKKKVMLSIGEEVEMDFSRFDPEATILWIRIDPEMLLIRELVLHQKLIHYEFMVVYERDVCAQLFAVDVFESGAIIQTIDVLNEVLLNDMIYYQVRIRALKALASTWTKFATSVIHARSLIDIFQSFYGSKSAPHIIAANNMVILPRVLQKYAIMQHFATAIGSVRDQNERCPETNVEFLLNLIFYNDNTSNRFSDDFQRAAFIDAIGASLTPSERPGGVVELSQIPEPISKIIKEMTLQLSLELMRPSYSRVVQVACLRVFCLLQALGHIPLDVDFFWQYTDATKAFSTVRVVAIECLVRLVKRHHSATWFANEMPRILEFIVAAREPRFKYEALKTVIANAPFTYNSGRKHSTALYPVNSKQLFKLITNYMVDENLDERMRLYFHDLYITLYGHELPVVLYSEEQAQPSGSHHHYGVLNR